MQLGTMTKTYQRDTLEEIFQALVADGLHVAQLNLASDGMDTMPAGIDEGRLLEIQRLAKQYAIDICCLSGTFNMIDPDEEARAEGCRRFDTLCAIAKRLGAPVISLCTGSKNPKSKWVWHDDNDSPQAWEDLLRTTEKILKSAEKHPVYLGVEIEASNVVNTPQRARKYMDAFSGSRLKILMDGANLFIPERVAHMKETLDEAFALVGRDIVLAHAKDLASSAELAFVAAGEGVLDFNRYLALLKQYGYDGALIMHGLSEAQVQSSARYLLGMMQRTAGGRMPRGRG